MHITTPRRLGVVSLLTLAAACASTIAHADEPKPTPAETAKPARTFDIKKVGQRDDGEVVQQKIGGTLRFRLPSEPYSMIPMLERYGPERLVNRYRLQSMIDRDEITGQFRPILATDWRQEEAGRRVVFELRKGVKWHDGEAFDAEDVLFSIRAWRAPNLPNKAIASMLANVEVSAPDPYTVVLVVPYPSFATLPGVGGLPILAEHQFGRTADDKPVKDEDIAAHLQGHPKRENPLGTGPYQQTEWMPGRFIVLFRDRDNWTPGCAIEQLEFWVITDSNEAITRLTRGGIDFIEVSPRNLDLFEEGGKYASRLRTIGYYPRAYTCIAWNNEREPFDDVRVRRAFSMAIDRNQLGKQIFGDREGDFRLATGCMYPDSPFNDATVQPLKCDMTAAGTLLDDAGWLLPAGEKIREKNGEKLKVTFTLTTGITSRHVENAMRAFLGGVGVELAFENLDWDTYLGKIRLRQFDACYLQWNLNYETGLQHTFATPTEESEAGSITYVGFSDRECDRLIRQINGEMDIQKRIPLYHKFHGRINELQPYTFLFYKRQYFAIPRYVEGVEEGDLFAEYDIRDWWIPEAKWPTSRHD
jgi:peptide/nickel transport system substrate-binding protein